MKTRPLATHPDVDARKSPPFHRMFACMVLLLAFLGTAGCESRGTDTTASDNTAQNPQPHNTATIKGSLAPVVGKIANAHLTVYRVQPDGTLQDISVGDFQTDPEGRFEILAAIENAPLTNLIIQARAPTQRPVPQPAADDNAQTPKEKLPTRLASTLLIQPLKPGAVTSIPPMDLETTLEADVYIRAHQLGLWDDAMCDQTHLRTAITPQLAIAIQQSENQQDQIDILTTTVTTGMRAFTSTLLGDPAFDDNSTPDDSQQAEQQPPRDEIRNTFTTENIQKARQDFRNEIEKLDRRTNEPDPNMTPERELINAMVKSYLDNDINIHALVRANQAAAEAARVFFPKLSPAANAAAASNFEVQRARLITSSIQSDFNTHGAPGPTSKSVQQAGGTLQNSLAALATHNTDISNDVHSLWQQYRQRVETELQSSFNPQQRQVVAQIQSDLALPTRTLFNTLENLTPEATTTETANTAAQAILLFHQNTRALADSEMWKNADINANQADAIVDILLNFATIR